MKALVEIFKKQILYFDGCDKLENLESDFI